MAKAEGWYGKAGSKWKTMPELMLQYRAAAFFGRLYCSDILMGMQTVEEVADITTTSTTPNVIQQLNNTVATQQPTPTPPIGGSDAPNAGAVSDATIVNDDDIPN
jgi:hypothetical protein